MDITVHCCTLRVIRHGGWSWGPEPRRVIQAAAQVLPMLIARRLEGLFSNESEGEISSPVMLQLPMKLVDLAEVTAEVRRVGLEAALLEKEKTAALDVALGRAVSPLRAQLRPVRFDFAQAEMPELFESVITVESTRDPPGVLRMLLDWRARGSLPAMLRGFSVAALEVWERELWLSPPDAHPQSEPSRAQVDELLATIVRALEAALSERLPELDSPPAALRTALLRRRLIAVVEIIARLEVSPLSQAVRAAIDRALPLPTEAPRSQTKAEVPVGRSQETALLMPRAATSATARTGSVTAGMPANVPATRPPSATLLAAPVAPTASASTQRLVDTRECAALPFLLLGPLSQIGLLDVMSAAFAASRRSHDLPAFAAGLALKVLRPPERGWRHRPEQLATAAAFAGLPEFPGELSGLADQRLDDVLPPIESVIARAVLGAHTAGRPLIAQRVDGGVLIADGEGLFPIACCEQEMLPTVIAGSRDSLYVSKDTADPKLLASLDQAGLRFVTDAPPTRGENFRRLAGAPTDHFWTNDANASDAELCALARPLSDFADELRQTWRALTTERPCAPRPLSTELDRTLALVAGVALAFIAWALWRTRETAHPRLALLRFGDFDARVGFSDRAVEVKLPLGRRHHDLRTHRLLDDIALVPWLSGRALRFAGG